VHEADPGLKVMITAEKPSADAVNISSLIDIWSPIINFMDNNLTICKYPNWTEGNQRPAYQPLVREGKTLWWYQSCMSEGCASGVQPAPGAAKGGCDASNPCVKGTWPSYMIDTQATFNRVMSWMSYQYDMEGELYWGANAADSRYSRQAENSWNNQWIAGGNGDGSLTVRKPAGGLGTSGVISNLTSPRAQYPGRPAEIGGGSFVPIASLRLKQIRDGSASRSSE
jgi:hypothetical protein